MSTKTLLLLAYVHMAYAAYFNQEHLCANASLNSCGSNIPSTCPSTASCLSLSWAVFPPYSYLSEKNKLSGIIPAILDYLLEACCDSCWKVNVTQPKDQQLVSDGSFSTDSDVVFPFYQENTLKAVENMSFVALINSPSVVYITKRQSTGGIPMKLLDAIFNSWPVLILAMLLSFMAGIFLWFLEHWKNREQFPLSFFKGSWEGFWWAFVSMTTVGYGDRAPKSFLGRSFAVFWILTGICICSVFTATLTTSLTTISLEEAKKLSRAKVGAIQNTLEEITGVQNQAKVVPFNSSKELWDAFWSNQVDGILLDSYLSATSTLNTKLKNNDLKISETVKSDGWSYGIRIGDAKLADCMRNKFHDADPSFISRSIAAEIEGEQAGGNEAEMRSASIFDPTGDLFWPSLYSCIGLTVVMVGGGLIWEVFIMTKSLKQAKTEPAVSRNTTNLDQMEKEMVSEVQRLFASWKAKLEEMGKTGPLEVVEMDRKP